MQQSSARALPARLWNQAYDQAKTSDPSTVDGYEEILTIRLSEEDGTASIPSHSADLASQQNQIAQDAGKRWMQMELLVQNGLHRTEKDAKVKQGMEEGIQAAMAVKEVVDKAIQASPEAAIAWVGVCFALEILMNPLIQASSNRQGIAYVVSRMEWYWNLANLLLEENTMEGHSPGLRQELEKAVTQLYAKLLLYQMKSVCYYHRGRLSVFARDLIKLDDWDGELSDIQAAEVAVQKDSEQYNTLAIRTRLGAIAETAKSQNAKLDSISLAIREQTKQQERMHETSADNKCLADLFLTDPRMDKKRIEKTNGGLLKDSYRWILDNPHFRQWRYNPQNQLLWVKADSGKGKTMLLCGIIDELQNSTDASGLLTYFFCQATNSEINNATAVLRGLLYMLAKQQPSLVLHIRKKYDSAGKGLFAGENAWFALTEIFASIQEDPNLKCMYLIVDALDECISDLPKLLDLVIRTSSSSSRIKWLLSSRNEPHIEQKLKSISAQARLSLELKQNAEQVARAVDMYIDKKLAPSTHSKTPPCEVNYQAKFKNTRTLVAMCGSFLTIVDDRVYLIHQSAKDYLSDEARAAVFRHQGEIHYDIFFQSLRLLSGTLKRDMYGLGAPGCLIDGITTPAPDPLATTQYSCIYWIDHLCDSTINMSTRMDKDVQDGGAIHAFLEAYYLYWLEALSFCKSMPKGVASMAELEALIHKTTGTAAVLDLVKDARRFIMYHKRAIEEAPLQAYVSALVFSPRLSLIRNLFEKEAAPWVSVKSPMAENGSACLHTLEGHSSSVNSVAFSHDSTRLASASSDNTVKVWDASNGACLHTLEGHSAEVMSVAFSHDSTRLASASHDNTVKVWDASSGACLQTLDIGCPLFAFSFNASSSCLLTEIGAINLDSLSSSSNITTTQKSDFPQYQATALSSNRTWITYNSKKVVWLPSEYRPSHSAVSGSMVGIGVGTGRVWMCNLDFSSTRNPSTPVARKQ
ncbi:nwd1 protein [Paraphaeosphaeria sporulosa]